MACLFLVRDDRPGDMASALTTARSALEKQGFRDVRERALPGWRMLHADPMLGGGTCFVEKGGDFIAVAGTLTLDGVLGAKALDNMLAAGSGIDRSRIGGHFVALIHRGGRTYILADPLGAFQFYRDDADRIFSTSLLAAAACLPRVTLDAQSVYEFAYNVVPVGNDTILSELKLLRADEAVELTHGGVVRRPLGKSQYIAADPAAPIEERLDGARTRLMRVVETHVAAFGDTIQCPLSGGFDSRLVLAALRAAGARPSVYVYGGPCRPDVTIAREIGRAEGFDVEWIDKGVYAHADREGFAETVAANFQATDALPNFGNVFDPGGNEAARLARHAGGALAVSGGAGEVYRDFFRLPDRRLPASAIVRAFFSRFSASDTTAAFDARHFQRRIRDKILDALGVPGEHGPLPRHLLEQAYPHVRCRALFGRELSLEARLSPYLMPFLDHHVVADAMTLPMRWKQAGRFQARLIAAIDPALARHRSTYGHDFAGAPGARHLWSEWVSRHRPLWLRERSYAIQRRMGEMDDEHGALDRAMLSAVMDADLPLMRRYFRVDRINDRALWRRIACLEYFAQALGSKLVVPAAAPSRRWAPIDRLGAPAHIT